MAWRPATALVQGGVSATELRRLEPGARRQPPLAGAEPKAIGRGGNYYQPQESEPPGPVAPGARARHKRTRGQGGDRRVATSENFRMDDHSVAQAQPTYSRWLQCVLLTCPVAGCRLVAQIYISQDIYIYI